MKYLEKAADCIRDARSDEKLDLLYDELNYLATEPLFRRICKQYDIFAPYRKAKGMADKKWALLKALQFFDDIAESVLDLNDNMDCVMDSVEEKEFMEREAANKDRVHALGCITFDELRQHFYEVNDRHEPQETAIVVFKPESFPGREYTEKERSYRIHSSDKMFCSGMGGYSLFGYCLDGTDQGIRLDQCMRFGEPKWKVDYCRLETQAADA